MTVKQYKNKSLILLLCIILPGWHFSANTVEDIATSFLAERKSLDFVKGSTPFHKQATLFHGKTLDLEDLHIAAHSLAAGDKKQFEKKITREELLIVYQGLLEVENDSGKTTLGPGSVVLTLPGENRKLSNASSTETSYYRFDYQSHKSADLKRAKKAGGGLVINWDEVEYMPSDIGGRRNFFDRPTAMFETFEMHVSTLNGGLTNHPAHTHRAEEFVLIMEGKVEMLLGDKTVQAQAGDLIYVESMIPHSLNNIGKDATTYFAFQFWQ